MLSFPSDSDNSRGLRVYGVDYKNPGVHSTPPYRLEGATFPSRLFAIVAPDLIRCRAIVGGGVGVEGESQSSSRPAVAATLVHDERRETSSQPKSDNTQPSHHRPKDTLQYSPREGKNPPASWLSRLLPLLQQTTIKPLESIGRKEGEWTEGCFGTITPARSRTRHTGSTTMRSTACRPRRQRSASQRWGSAVRTANQRLAAILDEPLTLVRTLVRVHLFSHAHRRHAPNPHLEDEILSHHR